jgi:hypothetical protein
MPAIIVKDSDKAPSGFDAAALNMKERTVLVDTEMDDGGWRMGPPFSEVHRAVLFAVIHSNPELRRLHAYYEPHMTEAQQKKNFDVGFFTARFDRFDAALNWSAAARDGIPGRHIAIAYRSEPVGVIGPYKTIRTCWKCNLEGYRDAEKTLPWVVPGQPCPRCRSLDWWATGITVNPRTGRPFIVPIQELQDAAAQVVAKETGADYYWNAFNGDKAQMELRQMKEKED